MICIRANLVAGTDHARFGAHTKVAALLFVNALDLASAEVVARKELAEGGWSQVEVERAKLVANYSQFNERDDVVGQAFRSAQASGFGHVIYPEPGA